MKHIVNVDGKLYTQETCGSVICQDGNLGAVDRLLKMFGEDSALKIELSGSVSNPSERFASFSDDELRQAIEALQKKSGEE